jgi:hypothetical protein
MSRTQHQKLSPHVHLPDEPKASITMVTATIAAYFHISDFCQALPQRIANKPSDRHDPNHGRDRVTIGVNF